MYYYLGLILLFLLIFQLCTNALHQFRRTRASANQLILEKQLIQQKVQLIREQVRKESPYSKAWPSWRKFRVSKIIQENSAVRSFYLTPHDGKPLPAFRPGQHLTFRIKIPGERKPLVRQYSLSNSPTENDYYRVTVQKLSAVETPSETRIGLASSYFHDVVTEQDILDVKAPDGQFYLNSEDNAPIVLVAGDIGITPLISMLNYMYVQGDPRHIWLFYSVRTPLDLIEVNHIKRLYKEMPNLHVYYYIDEIEDHNLSSVLHKGPLSVGRMQTLGAPPNGDYYVSGPSHIVKTIHDQLKAAGVDQARIHCETFTTPIPIAPDKPASNVEDFFGKRA